MILDRRLPSAVTSGPRSSELAEESAMNYRCFACPGHGVRFSTRASQVQLRVSGSVELPAGGVRRARIVRAGTVRLTPRGARRQQTSGLLASQARWRSG
jgi:hypothetical protein